VLAESFGHAKESKESMFEKEEKFSKGVLSDNERKLEKIKRII
jgi:hypothetical protein